MDTIKPEYLIEVVEIKHKPNYIKAKFRFLWDQYSPKKCQDIVFENSIIFRVKAKCKQTSNSKISMIYIQFLNINYTEENKLFKTIEFSSKEMKIKSRKFLSNDDTECWHLIGEKESSTNNVMFDVTLSMTGKSFYSLSILDETENWADFELLGEGGSVKIHKFAFAVVSPVFRRMLSTGCWKESLEGRMTIKGVTKQTLEHLKTYIYEQILPDTDLQRLLLLASYYEMFNLEVDCVNKIVENMVDADIYDVLEFAITNKAHRLSYAILNNCRRNDVVVNKLKELIINRIGESLSDEDTEDD